jgi:alpha 1,2-mannosyltransferase
MPGDPIACVTVSADFLPECRPNDPEQCAVWSNFEIADMNLWRSEAYTKYFDHLEASGGFYYEVSVPTSLP